MIGAVHKDEIDDFQDHLNRQNADIQFTKESVEVFVKIFVYDCKGIVNVT